MMGSWGYGMMGGYGWWGMLVMALFWIGVLLLVVWGVGALSGRRSELSDSPIDIARRRFARGEIDRAQFEEMKKALS
jgi:putative membrane protein